jgi:hypothetical protein
MSLHNYFFYLKKEMPWKTPTNCEMPYEIQDQKEKRSRETGKEVEGSEEVSIEERCDTTSSRTGSD